MLSTISFVAICFLNEAYFSNSSFEPKLAVPLRSTSGKSDESSLVGGVANV